MPLNNVNAVVLLSTILKVLKGSGLAIIFNAKCTGYPNAPRTHLASVAEQ